MSGKPVKLLCFWITLLLAVLCFLTLAGNRASAQDTAAATSTPQQQAATGQPHPDGIPVDTTSSTYRLQPYDLIDVDVYSEEDLHKPARLGSDGTVLLPLIGSVKVGGLSVAEATDLITRRYGAGYVKNPSVLITVLQYRKSTFSILGQVLRPSVYEIPEGANLNILDAISMSGGFLPGAAQNSVAIKRTVDGKETLFKVRAGDMSQDPNQEPFALEPGDSILVPSSQYRKSSFTILGQVNKPGLYDVPEGATVNIIDAISMAGGFTPTAAQNSVTVRRMVDGKLTQIKVKANDTEADPTAEPFEVLPGDDIVVAFRNSAFSILGQVDKPGIYEIPEGTHVNIIEAVLMAGGFTRTAAQNAVTVKRLVDGKLTTLKVRAGDMAEKEGLVPFEVLPGDIIKVNESWY